MLYFFYFFLSFFSCTDIGYKSRIDKIQKTEKNTSTCSDVGERELILEINEQPKNILLSGEPIVYQGQEIPIVVISDFSGGFYGGYPKIKKRGGGKIPWHWNTPEYSDILENGVFSFSGTAKYYPMLASLGVLFPQPNGQDKLIDLSSYNKNKNSPVVPKNIKAYTKKETVVKTITNKRFEGSKRSSFNQKVGLDSDFAHALKVAAKMIESTPEKSGVVWLLTDNINEMASSENSTDEQFTKQFYQYLSSNPKWQIIQTYTINKGAFLNGTSFVAYGMLYSSRELLTQEAYDSWTQTSGSPLEQKRLENFFQKYSLTTGSPIRMKPTYLDLATVSFDGTPFCQFTEQGQKRKCTIKAKITNELEHRVITSANITLVNKSMLPYRCEDSKNSNISKCSKLKLFYQGEPIQKDTMDISLSLDKTIGPKETKNYSWEIIVDPINVEHASLQDLWMSAKTSEFLHKGMIEVKITDIETKISEQSAKSIFGGENIPTFFKDFTANTNTIECLNMKTKNPNYTFAILFLGGLGLVIVGSLFIIQWIRPKYYTVTGDSRKQYTRDNPLLLRPLIDKEIIYDEEGNQLMVVSLTYDKKIRCLRNNRPIKPNGNLYTIEVADSYMNNTYEIEVAPLTKMLISSTTDISSSGLDSF